MLNAKTIDVRTATLDRHPCPNHMRQLERYAKQCAEMADTSDSLKKLDRLIQEEPSLARPIAEACFSAKNIRLTARVLERGRARALFFKYSTIAQPNPNKLLVAEFYVLPLILRMTGVLVNLHCSGFERDLSLLSQSALKFKSDVDLALDFLAACSRTEAIIDLDLTLSCRLALALALIHENLCTQQPTEKPSVALPEKLLQSALARGSEDQIEAARAVCQKFTTNMAIPVKSPLSRYEFIKKYFADHLAKAFELEPPSSGGHRKYR